MTRIAIHPDVPTDRAWKEGRRVYVDCGRPRTALDAGMVRLGGHWDPQTRARWVATSKVGAVVELLQSLIPGPLADGIDMETAFVSGDYVYVAAPRQSVLDQTLRHLGGEWDAGAKKLRVSVQYRERVIELIGEARDRRAAVEAIKALGLWVTIPYPAATVRDAAHAAGGVFDDTRKQWAMPTPEALAQITEAISEWTAQQQAGQAAEAGERTGRVAAGTGRVTTGETATWTTLSTRRMNRATAEREALPAGHVVRLDDGRRGVVTGVRVWFVDSESASSTCWHPQTHDEAHWHHRYDLALVEPTTDEVAADRRAEEEAADTARIHELVTGAAARTGARAVTEFTRLAEHEIVGRVAVTYGTASNPGGTLTLAADGRVIWAHPGFYDDYIRTEGITTDPELAGELRAVFAGGARVRTHVAVGQPEMRYQVTTRP